MKFIKRCIEFDHGAEEARSQNSQLLLQSNQKHAEMDSNPNDFSFSAKKTQNTNQNNDKLSLPQSLTHILTESTIT